MKEAWKPIPGYEAYEASTLGNVRSLNYNKTGRTRVLKKCINGSGYSFVWLCRSGARKRLTSVHKIVLISFRGPPTPGEQCRHLNGRKGDNRLKNLEWGTALENANDRESHGMTVNGTRINTAKLMPSDVQAIRAATGTQRAIADRFRVGQSQIHRIKTGKSWKHLLQ